MLFECSSVGIHKKYGFIQNINLSKDGIGTEVNKACLIDICGTLDWLMVTNVSPNFILEKSPHPPSSRQGAAILAAPPNPGLFQVWTPAPWDTTAITYVSTATPPITASAGTVIS